MICSLMNVTAHIGFYLVYFRSASLIVLIHWWIEIKSMWWIKIAHFRNILSSYANTTIQSSMLCWAQLSLQLLIHYRLKHLTLLLNISFNMYEILADSTIFFVLGIVPYLDWVLYVQHTFFGSLCLLILCRVRHLWLRLIIPPWAFRTTLDHYLQRIVHIFNLSINMVIKLIIITIKYLN